MRINVATGAFFWLMLLIGTVQADEVRLRNGGLVRGKVMESDPQRGVRIQMADGLVRDIPASDVAKVVYTDQSGDKPGGAEQPTGSATIQITSDETGSVYVAQPIKKAGRVRYAPPVKMGVVQKRVPLSVQVPDGLNRVRVEFDAGGSDGEDVNIAADATARVNVHGLSWWHDGPRVWIGGVIPTFWLLADEPIANTFGVQVALSLPIIEPIELRVALRGGAGFGFEQTSGGVVGYAAAEGVLRFALSSVYGMEAGVDAGFLNADGRADRETVPYVGPRISLMSLRVGPHRNSEITFRNTIPIYLPTDAGIDVGFTAELAFAVMAY